ncbi:MAG: YcgL domain-containing protein [Granulosicoccaceae bacterium]|jgi:uncharacterized protein YcgL (UPF0745 family)
MQCVIYKGRRKAETYLYIEQADDFARVPDTLLQILGELERVMDLTLSQAKPLANADVNEVMRLLGEQGYYLQMPPDPNLPRH